ncbi:palmitoyltransferase ZDHHC17-like isoform X1 [Octopus vulgaris]|uniref:Palmitoyltransferase n=1 Tax=Octopus vulgaris TaxID=6645 RepID=A0AA36FMK3_OCTVU|nr:palmitoyltransferase ZDHHC17-like isoform X1 [Octopus vulgaris]
MEVDDNEYGNSVAKNSGCSQQNQAEDYSNYDIVRATQYGAYKRCHELIEGGYDVNTLDKENVSLLHWAAINNRAEIVKYYLEKGAIVDRFGGDLNSTPLHWATRQGHLSMVVILMNYGADASLTDGEGCSCIHLAAQFGHTAIVAYLIAKGQDVDMLDKSGMTPLMWAAFRVFSHDPARLLLTFGASVNYADRCKKNSPLHWACQYGNQVVIKILVEAGANTEALNAKGETALDIALSLKNSSVIRWLRTARAERGIGHKHCLQVLTSKKSVRTNVMSIFPFVAVFVLGYIPELSLRWYYKLLLYLLAAGVAKLTIELFFDNNVSVVVPKYVSLATVFWLYTTWFICLLPYHSASAVPFIFALLSSAMFYNLWKSWRSDPGFISATRDEKYQTILEFAELQSISMNQFCSTCVVKRPIRSKHCSVCNKCVAKMDHHCPWINNCVGALNHKYFLAFLVFVLATLFLYIHSCALYWAHNCPWDFYVDGVTGIFSKIFTTSPWIGWTAINAAGHTIWVTPVLICQLYQVNKYHTWTSNSLVSGEITFIHA